MPLMVRSVIVLFFFMSVFSANAQTRTKMIDPPKRVVIAPTQVTDDGAEVIEPFDGTYQFIFTKGIKQVFADEIFKTIEQNRREEEDVTVTLSAYCKVLILSKKQITSTGFKPFSKSYVFEK